MEGEGRRVPRVRPQEHRAGVALRKADGEDVRPPGARRRRRGREDRRPAAQAVGPVGDDEVAEGERADRLAAARKGEAEKGRDGTEGSDGCAEDGAEGLDDEAPEGGEVLDGRGGEEAAGPVAGDVEGARRSAEVVEGGGERPACVPGDEERSDIGEILRAAGDGLGTGRWPDRAGEEGVRDVPARRRRLDPPPPARGDHLTDLARMSEEDADDGARPARGLGPEEGAHEPLADEARTRLGPDAQIEAEGRRGAVRPPPASRDAQAADRPDDEAGSLGDDVDRLPRRAGEGEVVGRPVGPNGEARPERPRDEGNLPLEGEEGRSIRLGRPAVRRPAPILYPARVHRWNWIVSPRDDLIYFIGSALAGYLTWLTVVAAAVPVPILWWVWTIVFDSPHLFATATRTYLDAEMRRERPLLLWGALAWFAVGPLAVLAGAGPLFFGFAYVWAYVHLVKQHYGFMVLYKRRNGDSDPAGDRVDSLYIRIALYAPYVAAVFAHPGMTAVLPAEVRAAGGVVVPAAVALTAAATFAYAAHQALRAAGGRRNLPKWLLLAAAIPLHWVVLASTSMPLMAIVMTLTLYHDIQYHRIVWHHNRTLYAAAAPAEADARFGRACTAMARSFALYALAGLGFAVCYRLPRWYNLNVAPRADWIEGLFWGFAFVHYWLDGRIWRIRRDPRIAVGLGPA